MQVKMEAPHHEQLQQQPQPFGSDVPDVFSRYFFDDPLAATSDAQPVNATETTLASLIDAQHRLHSINCVSKFLHALQHAKNEVDQALVLIVLRATATATDAKLSKACTAAFEKCGGLKIAKKWLNEAVEWNYSDLLVLLLDVLKVLPVQLTSITEARINEPIVKLRKTAQEDKVRRAAQDLLKHWRSRFTEKEKENEKSKSKSASSGSSTSTTSSTSSSTATTSVATTAAKTTAKADPKAATSSASAASTAPPKTTNDTGTKDAQPLKKRPIKRLDRAPFTGGSGASSASSAVSSSKSSELIGNLMQRKSAKDAALPLRKSSSDNKDSSSKVSSSKQDDSAKKPPSSSSKTAEPVLQLPAIQSFHVAAATGGAVSKKIRWADEEGKELVKIKLIESWRDMIHYQQPHDESSFKDAKLREHEAERQAMRDHKEREAFHVPMSHEWTTPALIAMPEALAARRAPVASEEVEMQSARTRREMEFLVLDGEVPPLSPKEWTRSNEPHRGAPKDIPLLDVDAATSSAAVLPAVDTGARYMEAGGESEEERALREALGPLQRSTIALLMENEHVLPMVYDEAQRNGNRIPDRRVVEIVEYHSRRGPPPPQQYQPHQHQQYHHQAPLQQPPPQRVYNAQPPPVSQGYDGGYNKYGGGGPPSGLPAPGGYDYNHGAMAYGGHPQQQQQQPPMHHASHKRKAPGGGNLAHAPPSKRLHKRGPNGGPPQCIYFLAPSGCKHGNTCQYAHDMVDGGAAGGNSYGHAAYNGPPPGHGGGNGNRFGGHQPLMGMRGGGPGGMRGMRGGR